VAEAGFPVWNQRMWSARGKLLGQVARNRRPEDPRPSLTLRREDLVGILRAAATREGAQIVTGRRMSEPGDLDGPAELVIGADGMWSFTRTLLNPAAKPPRYAGVYSVSGTAATLDTAAETGVFNMIFSRGGAFVHMTAPDGTIWWNAQVADSYEPSHERLDRTSPALLADLFRDCARVESILERARVDSRTLTHVLPETPLRHDRHHVLIGDAVHPVGAGQGASMALEDAVVLARHLAAARDDRLGRGRSGASGIPDALAAFDAARQKRLRKMTVAARRNRDAKTMGPLKAHVRDLVMPIVFPRAYPAATNWLYDFDTGSLPRS